MRRLVGLVLAALLLPSAAAGTARAPEVTDPRDVRATNADILAAWVEAEDAGVRVSIRTADGSMPEEFPDWVYWLYFQIEESDEEVGVALGFGADGLLRGFLGTGPDGDLNNERVWRGGFERVANQKLVALREDRGVPSTWSGVVPWGAVRGLEEGATLHHFVAGSAHYARDARAWEGGVDRAESDAVYVAEIRAGFADVLGGGIFPILVPAWMLPTIVAACTLAGAGGGWALGGLMRPRAKPAPTPTPVPLRAAPPPPGERFQRAPGTAGKR